MTPSRKTPRKAPRLTGTYSGHLRGFGFFVPARGGDDLFVPPGHEGNAIDGDTVEAERRRGDTVQVTRVLERGRARLAGTFLGRRSFSPDAHHIGKILTVTGSAKKGDKILVVPELDAFRIERVLGRSGAPDVEDAAVLAELGIAAEFPAAVHKETKSLPAPAESAVADRLDLRSAVTVVTIDPVTSRDFDDAISVERSRDGWTLGVHIADVSHYVQPGTALDAEARRRGTSVYLPGRVIPMLPERLSNDLCSLREGKNRFALSVLLDYDTKGDLRRTRFAESVIRPARRFSYERASRVMDGTRRESGRVGRVLRDMLQLSELLRQRRQSLELPRNETELVFDAAGNVVDLRSIAHDVAHGVIEEFMLAANQQVARLMLLRGVPTLFRNHPAPEDLKAVRDVLELLGMEHGPSSSSPSSSSKRRSSARVAKPGEIDLPRVVSDAVSKGFGPTVTSAVFRCMSRARYTGTDSSHFSLGFPAYCHFTSPIRRYADLTVHRGLRGLLKAEGKPLVIRPGAKPGKPKRDAAHEALGEQLTARAAAAERAESRIRRRRVLEFLLRQGPIPTTGQITGVVEKGLIVDLSEYGTSGFLATDALPGPSYDFEPGKLAGDRRTYRLGQDIEVCIHRIDPAASQLDLAPAPRYG